MRRILAALMAATVIGVPTLAQASTGWARYDGSTFVKWRTSIDAPAGEDLTPALRAGLAEFQLAKRAAIRGAKAAHRRWLVSQVPKAARGAYEPTGGRSWGAGAVQDLIRARFPSSEVPRALCTAYRESHFNPYAKNPHSSASGVFQFVASTWRSVSVRAGWGGASVFSAVANVAVAAWVVRNIGWSPWRGGCA